MRSRRTSHNGVVKVVEAIQKGIRVFSPQHHHARSMTERRERTDLGMSARIAACQDVLQGEVIWHERRRIEQFETDQATIAVQVEIQRPLADLDRDCLDSANMLCGKRDVRTVNLTIHPDSDSDLALFMRRVVHGSRPYALNPSPRTWSSTSRHERAFALPIGRRSKVEHRVAAIG